jgi:hypothetical protein
MKLMNGNNTGPINLGNPGKFHVSILQLFSARERDFISMSIVMKWGLVSFPLNGHILLCCR